MALPTEDTAKSEGFAKNVEHRDNNSRDLTKSQQVFSEIKSQLTKMSFHPIMDSSNPYERSLHVARRIRLCPSE